jgi:hypothetical protein
LTHPGQEIHIADNDFLIKLARWDLLDAFLNVVNATTRHVRVINSLRFRTGIAKGKPNLQLLGTAAAASRLDSFLRNTGPPTPIDNDFIAAATGKLNLDHGEIVLLAGLCHGAGHFFYTGDKRAIAALSAFVGTPYESKLKGRIVCLEQVIHRIVENHGIGTLRQNIAADLDADPGIANLLVGGAQTSAATLLTGLRSECHDLLQRSGGLLFPYPA